MNNIPHETTDFIQENNTITYYKRVRAEYFRMNLLEQWYPSESKWKMCCYHPWDKLKPIKELN